MHKRKYKSGTKLISMYPNFSPDCGVSGVHSGTILTVLYSKEYPGKYRFKGYGDDGWSISFIEDPERFIDYFLHKKNVRMSKNNIKNIVQPLTKLKLKR